MELKKYRWSRAYESAEEELVELLVDQKVEAERWTAEAGEVFDVHAHDYDKRLWCVDGSIVFSISGKDLSLQAGDTLDLPGGIAHSASAGFYGVTCYETHL